MVVGRLLPFWEDIFSGAMFSFLGYGNIQSEEGTFVCRPKRRGSYTYHRVEPHHHFSAVAGQKESPNDDIEDEAYDMRQRQPHGCQLIMTTQVTTKIRYCKGLKVDLLVEDAMDDFGDTSELEASRIWGLSLQKATLLKAIDTSKWIGSRVMELC